MPIPLLVDFNRLINNQSFVPPTVKSLPKLNTIKETSFSETKFYGNLLNIQRS